MKRFVAVFIAGWIVGNAAVTSKLNSPTDIDGPINPDLSVYYFEDYGWAEVTGPARDRVHIEIDERKLPKYHRGRDGGLGNMFSNDNMLWQK